MLIKYTLSIAISLLILIFFEGLLTMGKAFDFTNYTAIGYITQLLFIIIFVCIPICIIQEENYDSK